MSRLRQTHPDAAAGTHAVPPPDAPVYRGLTRSEIAFAYNPTRAVANHAAITADKRRRSDAALTRLGGRRDIRYGPHERQLLDIFPAGPGAPVLLYLHGGAWRTLDRRDYAFIVEPWLDHGVTVALPSYGRLPDCALTQQMRHAREAILWTHANIAAEGGDPDRLHVAGTSAGAHLLALASHASGCADRIQSMTLASGVYDFEPHRWHDRHLDMGLTDALVRHASPIHRPPARPDLPTLLAVGLQETPEMIRQTRDFHAQLRSRAMPAALLEAPGNHFEVGDWFGDASHPIFSHMLKMIQVS